MGTSLTKASRSPWAQPLFLFIVVDSSRMWAQWPPGSFLFNKRSSRHGELAGRHPRLLFHDFYIKDIPQSGLAQQLKDWHRDGGEWMNAGSNPDAIAGQLAESELGIV